jgi:integrase/recombinase XerD
MRGRHFGVTVWWGDVFWRFNFRKESIMVDPYSVRVVGPLAGCAEGFCVAMVGLGYTARTVRDQAYVLAYLSRWLAGEDLFASQLTRETAERFLQARKLARKRRWLTIRSISPILSYLRRVGLAPRWDVVVPDGPVENLLREFEHYLTFERRLAATTVRARVDVARLFLEPLVAEDLLETAALQAADVTGFVLVQGHRRRVGAMKVMVVALRSLLRFLYVTDRVPRDLSGAVPSVAGWSMSSLPKGVDASTLAALLDGCAPAGAVGLRDRAIITLMARLGLRAGEVASLCLDDIAWRSGELMVRGKGARMDKLPLPSDVGEVLADYLRHGRAQTACRAVFLRHCAPRGAMTARTVAAVPRSASVRAGVAMIGAHRLRHTAATGMLRGGATLGQVAQVLRHRDERTTALYAKVDRQALDMVARPWPGVA